MPAGTSFLIEKGMLGKTLKNVRIDGKDYVRIDVVNQYLHAVHPLAYTRRIDLKIDGEVIPNDQFFFVVRNQWIRGDHVKNIVDIYWYLCEPAQIYVCRDGGIAGGKHVVECAFTASYLEETSIIDLEDFWQQRTQTVVEEMTVEEE